MYGNPAGIHTKNDNWEFLVSSEKRFNTDLHSASITATKSLDKFSSAGIFLGRFGIEGYSETQLSGAYSRRLNDRLLLGINFSWYNLNISDYGQKSDVDFSMGLMWSPIKNLRLGAILQNPVSSKIQTLYIPLSLSFGGKYDLSANLSFFMEYEKINDRPSTVKTGIDYLINAKVRAFLSIMTHPSSPSFGIQLALSDAFNVTIGVIHHQLLGESIGLSLGYSGRIPETKTVLR